MDFKEALKKYGFTALVTMILAGTIALDAVEEMYKCSSTGEEYMAVGLTDTSKTAVNQYGIKKVCRNGIWEKEQKGEPLVTLPESVLISANNKEWICPTDKGRITSHTKCSSGGYQGYLGEFI